MRGSEDVLESPEDDYKLLMRRLRIFAKRRMVESGVTQRQLARNAHLSAATISNWLQGGDLEVESLTKLCGALDDLRPHATTASVLREAEALAATG